MSASQQLSDDDDDDDDDDDTSSITIYNCKLGGIIQV